MSQTKKYPLPVAGVDVLSNETSLIPGAARSAKNVDIGRSGQYQRRTGYTMASATPGLHSLYYAAQRGWTFVALDAQMHRLNTDTYARTSLVALGSAFPVAYAEYNGNVYFTNRTSFNWVPSDSATARQVGVPVPPAPTLSTTAGALLPGTYGLVMTTIDDRGEESGATPLQSIKLATGGGIRLSGLPALAGMELCVYITSADGDVLRRAATLPAVFPAYDVAEDAQGGICSTQFLKPMPAGDMVRWHNGRLYTAKFDTLSFSEAMRPHIYNRAHNMIQFSGWITFIEPVVDGIYVGDSRGVWFLAGGDPGTKITMRRVSTYRAVHRSSLIVPSRYFPEKQVQSDAPVAVWLSTAGYIVGMPGGNIVELHSDRVQVPTGLLGRSTLLLRDGRKQIITTVNSTTTAANGVATDSTI
jgi:hypothetical protein